MMTNTHTKTRRSDESRKTPNVPSKCSDLEFDNLATELEMLARKSLPDGVRQGIFSNQEAEIRNDAVILALQWFVRRREQTEIICGGERQPAWHAPRELANALKYAKLRHLELVVKGVMPTEPLNEINGGTTPHPSDLLPHECPEPIKREMLSQGIRIAVNSGRISHANACIARLVYLEGIPVSRVAKQRGVHRTAINQRLWRIIPVLREVLEHVEVPSMA
jgi:hypothetical protein